MPYVQLTRNRNGTSRWKKAGLGILAAATIVILVALFLTQQQRRSEAAGEAASYTPAPSAIVSPSKNVPSIGFLGDSYVNGSSTVQKSQTYVALAAKELGVPYGQFGTGGIGYTIGNSSGGMPMPEYVPELVQYAPDYVVVQGGYNELGQDNDKLRIEAERTFAEIRSALPDAPLLVVGPFNTATTSSTGALGSRDAVRAAAKAVGVPFVDPLDEGWFTGPELLEADGIHLNLKGQQAYKDRLIQALSAADMLPAVKS